MAEFQRLLVATDFSDAANYAIDRAALITNQNGARLDLIHIATPALLDKFRQLTEDEFGETQQSLLEAALGKLNAQANVIRDRYGIHCDIHLASESLIKALVSHASSLATDLIVLGFCGASMMRHFLMGSTAERLVTKAPCPMLVVKRAADDHYRSLLVPVDFSPISLPALSNGCSIAPHANISVLHVYEAPLEGKLHYAGLGKDTISHNRVSARQESMRLMQGLCKAAGVPPQKARLLAIHGNPSHRILAQEVIRDCDLIAMGKHSESLLENLFVGSVTRHVTARSQCDVLVSI
jgi:nucleotide-binding universal stress UspA family protein